MNGVITNLVGVTQYNGVITNVVSVPKYEGGYETFSDAVKGMMDECLKLTLEERVSLAKRHYCNEIGDDYMIAVRSYDEETGEAWESMTLAEAVARLEDEEEEEEEEE